MIKRTLNIVLWFTSVVSVPLCSLFIVGCPTGQVQQAGYNSSQSKSATEGTAFSVVFGGKDFFPLGWYTDLDTTRLPAIKACGMNLVIPYCGRVSNERIALFIDAAARNDLYVILEIDRKSVLRVSDDGENLAEVLTRVLAFRNKPNLLGWYLADEPHLFRKGGLSPTVCRLVYEAIKKVDPDKPVFIVETHWGWTGRWDDDPEKSYAVACDVAMWDEYPLRDGVSIMDSKIIQVAKTAQQTLEVVRKELRPIPLLAVLQGYGLSGKAGKENYPVGNSGRRRDPSYEELRYMTYTSLVHGSRGVVYWAFYRADSLVESRVCRVVHEIHSERIPELILEPTRNGLATSSHDEIDSDGNGVQDLNYELRWKNRFYHLIAVNDSPEDFSEVTFSFAFSSPIRSVTAINDDSEGGDRRIDPDQLTTKGFRDGFLRFQVHHYEIEIDSVWWDD